MSSWSCSRTCMNTTTVTNIMHYVSPCDVGVCFLREQLWSFMALVTADVLDDNPETLNMLFSVTLSSQSTALVAWFSVSFDDRLPPKGSPFDTCDFPLTCHFTSGALQGPKHELLSEIKSMLSARPNSWSFSWSRGCSCETSPVTVSNVLVQLGFRCDFSCSLHGRCLVRHILWWKVLLQVSHL